jgi:hypothetical protein
VLDPVRRSLDALLHSKARLDPHTLAFDSKGPNRSSIRITCDDDDSQPLAVGIAASFRPAAMALRFVSRRPVDDKGPDGSISCEEITTIGKIAE